MRPKRIGGVLATALACLVLASPAAAWKEVMTDFNYGETAGRAVAEKCKGGKLGYYDFTARAASSVGDFFFEVEADMPVFSKWRQFKDVHVAVQSDAFDVLPPQFQIEFVNAWGTFYDTIFTRYVAKKDELEFRHQGLSLFGGGFPPGESEVKFKPKQGC